MKFLITLALIASVASAAFIHPNIAAEDLAELQEVIAAINSPSTDPATAAALEQQLLDLIGHGIPQPVIVGPADAFEPVEIGPAIIEPHPVAIGPAIIDFPLPDGGALTNPIEPSPVVVGPVPAESSPLVQIIVNVNQAGGPPAPVVPNPVKPSPVQIVEESPIVPTPVIVEESPIVPAPVIIVDTPVAPEPVLVATPVIIPTPVMIEESPVAPAPVAIVDAPVAPEPVLVGTPVIIPSPAIVLPETLN